MTRHNAEVWAVAVHCPAASLEDVPLLLLRRPSSSDSGGDLDAEEYIYELPSGPVTGDRDDLQDEVVAALAMQTGLILNSRRLRMLGSRRLPGQSDCLALFAAMIAPMELELLQQFQPDEYPRVHALTVRQLRSTSGVGWAVLGMLCAALWPPPDLSWTAPNGRYYFPPSPSA